MSWYKKDVEPKPENTLSKFRNEDEKENYYYEVRHLAEQLYIQNWCTVQGSHETIAKDCIKRAKTFVDTWNEEENKID